jgi:hypothetical protein
MIMIARRLVPQFGFAITIAGRDFGSGREEEVMGEFLGLETSYCTITSFFFDTVAWSVHALVPYICMIEPDLYATRTAPITVYPNVRAKYLGQCCEKEKRIEEERDPTGLTKSNSLW